MPVVIKIPQALRKVFNDEAEAAFVDVLNQIQDEQRNGVERALEMHLNAFREYLDRRLLEAKSETDKRFAEIDIKMEKRFAEADAKMEKRFAEADAKMEKRFAEADVKMERRLTEYHRATLRWMFTFFIGTVLALLGSVITYLQIAVK
jgi:hypothetical protein